MGNGYEQFTHVLATLGQIVIIAFVIERVLDFAFDYYPIRMALKGKKGFKALVPLVMSLFVCFSKNIDIIAALYASEPHLAGILLTALFMTGCSSAAMTVFNQVLGISQSVRRERKAILASENDRLQLELITEYRKAVRSKVFPLQACISPLGLGNSDPAVLELKSYLSRLGYLQLPTERGLFDEITQSAVKRYQSTMGLKPDGEVGPITRSLLTSRRCGVHDCVKNSIEGAAASTICRWEETNLTYAIGYMPSGVDANRCRRLVKQAFETWSSIVDLAFTEIENISNAKIKIWWELPDYEEVLAPYTVYGYGYYPCSSRPGVIILDESESWLDDDNAPNSDGYFIRLTLQHEIGHALGLDHSNTDIQNIMHSSPHTAGLRSLSEEDKIRIQQLYA